MIKNKSRLIIIFVFFFTHAHAQKMYKWTDENGTIHYSHTEPEQSITEQISLSKRSKGDQQCCLLLRELVGGMLSRSNTMHSKKYNSLFQSKDFNVIEINNFVDARARSRISNSKISSLAYTKCMNSGFNFCRTPMENFANKSPKSWSGSGFIVTKEGHIITNEHVAGNCKKIMIQPLDKQARLVAKDADFDLALLKIDGAYDNFAKFSVGTVVLGQEVVTAGFPYKNLLSSSIKISTGIVSSLAGVRDDNNVVQITAPIQPGSSGGPLIDPSGYIIGAIVSKLDSKQILKYLDDIPQNINFAIKGKHIKRLLYNNNVRITEKVATAKLEVTEISQKAQDYTVEINCIN
ncbi:MAG: trypsin-like peptidase domain-containing protein [Proteobacteria bacterium]|nr:trypsin-like peptidase domain-containing protein [Pseudomonadota bacterium]